MSERDPHIVQPFSLKVWGDSACFSRPEHNPESVSYPVITPTAAVGLLKSIFWKPEMRWDVTAVDILKPVRWAEATFNGIKSATSTKQGSTVVNAPSDRIQIHELYLRDVAYVIHADITVLPHADAPVQKYLAQMNRRVDRGAYYQAPYLGKREDMAYFGRPCPDDKPLPDTFTIGAMVHDIDYDGSAIASASYFYAQVVNGRLNVPALEGV